MEYYSPRRVIGVLNRCGTDEFIVSSTSAQASPVVGDLIAEAEEIKCQAGARAHIFDWVTWHLFRQDRKLVSCAHCSPNRLMGIAQLYPDVRFDFAHCRPMDEMASVIAQCDNVWTDTAYMALRTAGRGWSARTQMTGNEFAVSKKSKGG